MGGISEAIAMTSGAGIIGLTTMTSDAGIAMATGAAIETISGAGIAMGSGAGIEMIFGGEAGMSGGAAIAMGAGSAIPVPAPAGTRDTRRAGREARCLRDSQA